MMTNNCYFCDDRKSILRKFVNSIDYICWYKSLNINKYDRLINLSKELISPDYLESEEEGNQSELCFTCMRTLEMAKQFHSFSECTYYLHESNRVTQDEDITIALKDLYKSLKRNQLKAQGELRC